MSSLKVREKSLIRVPTDLENLENSWNFVNLENSWKTPGILWYSWNFLHDKLIYAGFDTVTAVLYESNFCTL